MCGFGHRDSWLTRSWHWQNALEKWSHGPVVDSWLLPLPSNNACETPANSRGSEYFCNFQLPGKALPVSLPHMRSNSELYTKLQVMFFVFRPGEKTIGSNKCGNFEILKPCNSEQFPRKGA